MKNKITGFKAFDQDLKCRGFQYEVGKTYDETNISMCNRGFHFCENPFDILDFYDLCESRFASVEALASVSKTDNKKTVTGKITISAELCLSGFVKACVDKLLDICSSKVDSGDSAQLASSGDYAQLASSGDYAKLASSGHYAKMASSGYSAKMASSGYSVKLASSGDSAQLASSGYYAQLASRGDYAQLASSGDYAKLASSGENSVVCAIGKDSKAKGKKGNWITLAEYADNGTPFVKTRKVDGNHIKEDVYYKLKDKKFIESK